MMAQHHSSLIGRPFPIWSILRRDVQPLDFTPRDGFYWLFAQTKTFSQNF